MAFAASFSAMADQDPVPLDKAIKSGLVKIQASGNSESTHYLKPMILEFYNPKNTSVEINVEPGWIFIAGDTSYQNLIVTDEIFVQINPNGKKKVEIWAMCIEDDDRAPSTDVVYKMDKLAEPNLLGLVQMIAKNNWHNSEAQHAVWAMACNSPVEDIAGYNTAMVQELQKYVCTKKGIELPPPPAEDDYEHNYDYARSNFKREIGGWFEFDFPKKSEVHVAMFDANGILVRELYNNKEVAPGFHKIEFAFDATVYNDDKYYIKMIVNGEVLLKRMIDFTKMR
jgi:hypothetical protein